MQSFSRNFPQIPEAFFGIVKKLVQHDASRRYQSAHGVVRDLKRLLHMVRRAELLASVSANASPGVSSSGLGGAPFAASELGSGGGFGSVGDLASSNQALQGSRTATASNSGARGSRGNGAAGSETSSTGPLASLVESIVHGISFPLARHDVPLYLKCEKIVLNAPHFKLRDVFTDVLRLLVGGERRLVPITTSVSSGARDTAAGNANGATSSTIAVHNAASKSAGGVETGDHTNAGKRRDSGGDTTLMEDTHAHSASSTSATPQPSRSSLARIAVPFRAQVMHSHAVLIIEGDVCTGRTLGLRYALGELVKRRVRASNPLINLLRSPPSLGVGAAGHAGHAPRRSASGMLRGGGSGLDSSVMESETDGGGGGGSDAVSQASTGAGATAANAFSVPRNSPYGVLVRSNHYEGGLIFFELLHGTSAAEKIGASLNTLPADAPHVATLSSCDLFLRSVLRTVVNSADRIVIAKRVRDTFACPEELDYICELLPSLALLRVQCSSVFANVAAASAVGGGGGGSGGTAPTTTTTTTTDHGAATAQKLSSLFTFWDAFPHITSTRRLHRMLVDVISAIVNCASGSTGLRRSERSASSLRDGGDGGSGGAGGSSSGGAGGKNGAARASGGAGGNTNGATGGISAPPPFIFVILVDEANLLSAEMAEFVFELHTRLACSLLCLTIDSVSGSGGGGGAGGVSSHSRRGSRRSSQHGASESSAKQRVAQPSTSASETSSGGDAPATASTTSHSVTQTTSSALVTLLAKAKHAQIPRRDVQFEYPAIDEIRRLVWLTLGCSLRFTQHLSDVLIRVTSSKQRYKTALPLHFANIKMLLQELYGAELIWVDEGSGAWCADWPLVEHYVALSAVRRGQAAAQKRATTLRKQFIALKSMERRALLVAAACTRLARATTTVGDADDGYIYDNDTDDDAHAANGGSARGRRESTSTALSSYLAATTAAAAAAAAATNTDDVSSALRVNVPLQFLRRLLRIPYDVPVFTSANISRNVELSSSSGSGHPRRSSGHSTYFVYAHTIDGSLARSLDDAHHLRLRGDAFAMLDKELERDGGKLLRTYFAKLAVCLGTVLFEQTADRKGSARRSDGGGGGGGDSSASAAAAAAATASSSPTLFLPHVARRATVATDDDFGGTALSHDSAPLDSLQHMFWHAACNAFVSTESGVDDCCELADVCADTRKHYGGARRFMSGEDSFIVNSLEQQLNARTMAGYTTTYDALGNNLMVVSNWARNCEAWRVCLNYTVLASEALLCADNARAANGLLDVCMQWYTEHLPDDISMRAKLQLQRGRIHLNQPVKNAMSIGEGLDAMLSAQRLARSASRGGSGIGGGVGGSGTGGDIRNVSSDNIHTGDLLPALPADIASCESWWTSRGAECTERLHNLAARVATLVAPPKPRSGVAADETSQSMASSISGYGVGDTGNSMAAFMYGGDGDDTATGSGTDIRSHSEDTFGLARNAGARDDSRGALVDRSADHRITAVASVHRGATSTLLNSFCCALSDAWHVERSALANALPVCLYGGRLQLFAAMLVRLLELCAEDLARMKRLSDDLSVLFKRKVRLESRNGSNRQSAVVGEHFLLSTSTHRNDYECKCKFAEYIAFGVAMAAVIAQPPAVRGALLGAAADLARLNVPRAALRCITRWHYSFLLEWSTVSLDLLWIRGQYLLELARAHGDKAATEYIVESSAAVALLSGREVIALIEVFTLWKLQFYHNWEMQAKIFDFKRCLLALRTGNESLLFPHEIAMDKSVIDYSKSAWARAHRTNLSASSGSRSRFSFENSASVSGASRSGDTLPIDFDHHAPTVNSPTLLMHSFCLTLFDSVKCDGTVACFQRLLATYSPLIARQLAQWRESEKTYKNTLGAVVPLLADFMRGWLLFMYGINLCIAMFQCVLPTGSGTTRSASASTSSVGGDAATQSRPLSTSAAHEAFGLMQDCARFLREMSALSEFHYGALLVITERCELLLRLVRDEREADARGDTSAVHTLLASVRDPLTDLNKLLNRGHLNPFAKYALCTALEAAYAYFDHQVVQRDLHSRRVRVLKRTGSHGLVALLRTHSRAAAAAAAAKAAAATMAATAPVDTGGTAVRKVSAEDSALASSSGESSTTAGGARDAFLPDLKLTASTGTGGDTPAVDETSGKHDEGRTTTTLVEASLSSAASQHTSDSSNGKTGTTSSIFAPAADNEGRRRGVAAEAVAAVTAPTTSADDVNAEEASLASAAEDDERQQAAPLQMNVKKMSGTSSKVRGQIGDETLLKSSSSKTTKTVSSRGEAGSEAPGSLTPQRVAAVHASSQISVREWSLGSSIGSNEVLHPGAGVGLAPGHTYAGFDHRAHFDGSESTHSHSDGFHHHMHNLTKRSVTATTTALADHNHLLQGTLSMLSALSSIALTGDLGELLQATALHVVALLGATRCAFFLDEHALRSSVLETMREARRRERRFGGTANESVRSFSVGSTASVDATAAAAELGVESKLCGLRLRGYAEPGRTVSMLLDTHAGIGEFSVGTSELGEEPSFLHLPLEQCDTMPISLILETQFQQGVIFVRNALSSALHGENGNATPSMGSGTPAAMHASTRQLASGARRAPHGGMRPRRANFHAGSDSVDFVYDVDGDDSREHSEHDSGGSGNSEDIDEDGDFRYTDLDGDVGGSHRRRHERRARRSAAFGDTLGDELAQRDAFFQRLRAHTVEATVVASVLSMPLRYFDNANDALAAAGTGTHHTSQVHSSEYASDAAAGVLYVECLAHGAAFGDLHHAHMTQLLPYLMQVIVQCVQVGELMDRLRAASCFVPRVVTRSSRVLAQLAGDDDSDPMDDERSLVGSAYADELGELNDAGDSIMVNAALICIVVRGFSTVQALIGSKTALSSIELLMSRMLDTTIARSRRSIVLRHDAAQLLVFLPSANYSDASGACLAALQGAAEILACVESLNSEAETGKYRVSEKSKYRMPQWRIGVSVGFGDAQLALVRGGGGGASSTSSVPGSQSVLQTSQDTGAGGAMDHAANHVQLSASCVMLNTLSAFAHATLRLGVDCILSSAVVTRAARVDRTSIDLIDPALRFVNGFRLRYIGLLHSNDEYYASSSMSCFELLRTGQAAFERDQSAPRVASAIRAYQNGDITRAASLFYNVIQRERYCNTEDPIVRMYWSECNRLLESDSTTSMPIINRLKRESKWTGKLNV